MNGNFTMIENSVIDSLTLSKHEKLVYVVLARFADNESRQCFPSRSTIAKRSGLSEKSVFVALKGLEGKGFIVKQHQYEPGSKEYARNLYSLQGTVTDTVGTVTDTAQVRYQVPQGTVTGTYELYSYNDTHNKKTSFPTLEEDRKGYVAHWKRISKKEGEIPYPEEFEEWWRCYPKHTEKKKGFRRWLKTIENGTDAELLITAARNYADEKRDTERQFIKNASTFLSKDEPWRDSVNTEEETLEETKPSIDIFQYAGGMKYGS